MAVPAGQGRIVSDSRASGGQALQIWNSATAAAQIDATEPYGRVWLRARGNRCDGSSPIVRVAVDGRTAYAAVFDQADFRDVETFVDVGTGVHTLGVTITNYVKNAGIPLLVAACDRSVFLDAITFKPSPPLFASDSWRNRPLPDNEPIDGNSAAYVAQLGRDVQTTGAWVNTTSYSTPIYVAGVQAATRQVQVDQVSDPVHAVWGATAAALRTQWSSVPLPRDAQPARGTDSMLTVYQPATDTMWEFWRFSYDLLGNPRAVFGGRVQHVSQDPGYYRDPPAGPGRNFGATATSIPFLAGVQRIGELQQGSIDHAVDFAAPSWRQSFFRWPAQRTDVVLTHSPPAQPLPEGIRFRLPPNLDIDSLGLPPYTRMLARAVQRYGMVMDNSGDDVAFMAEAPKPGDPNPYEGPTGFFGGQHPDDLLAGFPWDRLQAIADTGQP